MNDSLGRLSRIPFPVPYPGVFIHGINLSDWYPCWNIVLSGTFAAAKQSADNLSKGIGHHGIEGEIREIAARECLEPFLTQSYKCGTGKLVDSLQALSDQIDLVVYRRKVVTPILVNRDLGFFPVECVRYVFEVKATLTATEVKDANKKFTSIKKLISFPKRKVDGGIKAGSLPSTVLFAFSSDISGSELDRYRKHTDDEHPPCTIICVLGKGYWFHDATACIWYGREIPPELPQFCMFISGFMNTWASEETSLKPFAPGAYVNTDDVVFKPIGGPRGDAA